MLCSLGQKTGQLNPLETRVRQQVGEDWKGLQSALVFQRERRSSSRIGPDGVVMARDFAWVRYLQAEQVLMVGNF